MVEEDFEGIERILGYHFFERQHLLRALTHPACAHELIQQKRLCLDQEAYSTLGDAVLKTSLILFLMEKGMMTKGEITQAKEDIESNAVLARVGKRLKIRKYIRLGRGAQDLVKSGEETILADTIEALIGAIFLDSDAGFGIVRQCIATWFAPELEKPQRVAAAPKKPEKKVPAAKSAGKGAGTEKAKPVPVPVKKQERLVPQQISPLPSSSRREAPRGTRSGSRQPSRR